MENTKQQILNSSLKLFIQKGFKEVTMQDIITHSGISKGAFYHYFTSKEQVFEEVVISFYSSVRIADYDSLSSTSLHEFYKNWVKTVFNNKNLLDSSAKDGEKFAPNHYYLLFDGIRLIPSFKEILEKHQKQETTAWIKIIDIAKKSGEIETTLSSMEVAKLFMYVSDGLTTDLLLQNKLTNLKTEATKVWDSIYTLVKA